MVESYKGDQTFTNDITGEKFTNFLSVRRSNFPEEIKFMSFFDLFFEYVSTHGITGNEAKVLFTMLKYIEFENWIRIGIPTLAEELGLAKQNVHKSVKTLLDKGILLQVVSRQDRRRKDYRFNPCYGWKGTVREWKKAIALTSPEEEV